MFASVVEYRSCLKRIGAEASPIIYQSPIRSIFIRNVQGASSNEITYKRANESSNWQQLSSSCSHFDTRLLEPQYPSIGVFEIHRICRWTDFETLELWNVRSGRPLISTPVKSSALKVYFFNWMDGYPTIRSYHLFFCLPSIPAVNQLQLYRPPLYLTTSTTFNQLYEIWNRNFFSNSIQCSLHFFYSYFHANGNNWTHQKFDETQK